MNYNVNWDSIFPDDDPDNHELREFDREDAFARMMRVIRPDILCLQEINYLRGTQELGQFLGEVMGDGAIWQVANVRDILIGTRFELVESGYELVTGSPLLELQQAAALIDLPDEQYTADLYMICAHFKSSGSRADILLRSRQADVIMAHVRDLTTSGGAIDLPDRTPFVILGDFNIYDTDPALHLRTLVNGDIYDEGKYGPDLEPDWDQTELADALPNQNGSLASFYTWRNDAEPFLPGALDRIIYSDSALEIANSFVLNTNLLADQLLQELGLLKNDVLLDPAIGYYDHLPVVVDFVILP